MDKFVTRKRSGDTLEKTTAVSNNDDDDSSNKKLEKNGKVLSTRNDFKIISMNSNSLANRISDKKTHNQLKEFIAKHVPDIISFQEVRMPAKTITSNAKKNDGTKRVRNKMDDRKKEEAVDKRLLETSPAFQEYNTYYSLSDYRYAGNLVLYLYARLCYQLFIDTVRCL